MRSMKLKEQYPSKPADVCLIFGQGGYTAAK